MVNTLPSSVMVRPTTSGSDEKRRFQKAWPMIATGSPSRRSSSGRKARPSIGSIPRRGNRSDEARTDQISSGSPAPVRVHVELKEAARPSKEPIRSRQAKNSPKETGVSDDGGWWSSTRTSRSGSRNGSGRNRTPRATLKMTVVAPIPSASVSTASVVNPGLHLMVLRA